MKQSGMLAHQGVPLDLSPISLVKSVILFLPLLFLCVCSSKLEFEASIKSKIRAGQAYEGETHKIVLQLKNIGKKEWRSESQPPCFLSYHLLDKKGKMVRFDNARTPLPKPIRPGELLEISVKVKAPLESGSYFVEFDLVREGLAWFKDLGSKTLIIPLEVRRRIWPEDLEALEYGTGKWTAFRSSVPEFETLGRLIRITLGHNETEFYGRTGKIHAFTAGGGYPQVWLRDEATNLAAARYYYPESFLSSWLEEHLALQQEDGALFDWFDSQGRVDKNTVETDQEASAIQAAYQVFLLRGPDWLKRKIAGEPIIDRLEKALVFVFKSRFDQKYGLVMGAHTADWGDVDIIDSDERAIYADENTHWTVDIYDQSMCFEACIELARMWAALAEREKASFWQARAESLKQKTNHWLWQEDKGFYRVHLHLDSLKHDFEEDNMFPMGGNAQAILSGLADAEKARRIIHQALKRQQEFEMSTISGSLLPPYPPGLFKHPAMDEPYEYQNGGQWDWFGGRLIYAMFENGFSRRAKEKLIEIVRKNITNAGLYEWETQEGSGRGSDYYAGSAGSLAKALWEGYFGIKLEKKSLILSPRLGEDEATVRVYLPAIDLFIIFDSKLDRGKRKMTFRCHSNFPYSGQVRLLVPRDFLGNQNRLGAHPKLDVRSNGQRTRWQWQSLHEDDYITVESDFRNHTLEIFY